MPQHRTPCYTSPSDALVKAAEYTCVPPHQRSHSRQSDGPLSCCSVLQTSIFDLTRVDLCHPWPYWADLISELKPADSFNFSTQPIFKYPLLLSDKQALVLSIQGASLPCPLWLFLINPFCVGIWPHSPSGKRQTTEQEAWRSGRGDGQQELDQSLVPLRSHQTGSGAQEDLASFLCAITSSTAAG